MLGGFVYWDAHWACCGVSSLKLGSGLCFDKPKRLSCLAGGGGDFIRAALFDNDRIERVTLPELLHRGVTGFCWLTPGEKFPGQHPSRAHPWPDGASAHSNPNPNPSPRPSPNPNPNPQPPTPNPQPPTTALAASGTFAYFKSTSKSTSSPPGAFAYFFDELSAETDDYFCKVIP